MKARCGSSMAAAGRDEERAVRATGIQRVYVRGFKSSFGMQVRK